MLSAILGSPQMCTESIKINVFEPVHQLNKQMYLKNFKEIGDMSLFSHLAVNFMSSLASCIPDYSSL